MVASIRSMACAVTLTKGNEQVQSLTTLEKEKAATMNVNAPPPYALMAVGDRDASKGTADASSVNEKVAFRAPSRADHET